MINEWVIPRVLLVEDDLNYRAMITRLIRQIDEDIEMVVVENAQMAMAQLEKTAKSQSDYIDLIVSDLDLKSIMSGVDLWNYSKVHLPKAQFQLISGLPLDKFLEFLGETTEIPAYLPKPFRLAQCRDLILSLLSGKLRTAA